MTVTKGHIERIAATGGIQLKETGNQWYNSPLEKKESMKTNFKPGDFVEIEHDGKAIHTIKVLSRIEAAPEEEQEPVEEIMMGSDTPDDIGVGLPETKSKDLETVKIQGKDYVMVHTRITEFRRLYPNWSIETKVLKLDKDFVCIRAQIIDDKYRTIASGHALEEKTGSFINKTSYVENCETSAIGRALAVLGIGIDKSMASAEELANAIKNQGR